MALSDDLVAWYDLGQNFTEHLYAWNQVPPNRNPLTPEPFSSAYLYPLSAAGKIGKCAEFWYTQTTFILLASASASEFLFNRNKTVTFWVKFRSFNDVNAIFWKSLPTGSPEYCVRVTDITHKLIVNETITHADVLQLDTWYFVVITYQHATSTWRIGVNDGIPTAGVDAVTTTADLFGIGGNPTIDGFIDEFAIWDRNLTAGELTELYNNGDGMSYEDVVPPNQAACREAECCPDDLYAYVSAAGEGRGFNSSCEPLPKVIFEPTSGSVLNLPSLVLLRADNPDAVIHYTTDGSVPDVFSAIYSTAITVESPATIIRAIAVVQGCPAGIESNAQYLTWTPAAHFTYACTTTDRSGQWGAFAANGSADYNWELQIQFTSITGVRRFDILQLDDAGKFTGAAWSTKEFITPWEDDISKLHHAFPLVIWIGGVQQNVAYLDDYSATLGNFAAAGHTLDMHGQPWTTLPATNIFKLLVTFADGSTMSRIVDSTCDALPAALCPVPAFTLATACGPLRIDVTFSLGIGTAYTIWRRIAGTADSFTLLVNAFVASSPQTYQDTTVVAGVSYEYFMSNIPALCSGQTYSSISQAQATPNALVIISASPSTIDPGGSSTVSWNSSSNNGTVSIAPTIGVQPGNVAGNQVVSPAVTTTYTITGQNICGTVATAQATVTVNPAASCGPSPPANATIQGYHDAFFSAAACTLTAGGSTPWNGQYIREGISSCVYRPFQAVAFNLAGGKTLNNTNTSISVGGGLWTLFVYGITGGSNVNIWTGTKTAGDTALGVYTRTSGCSLTPATLTIV